MGTNAAFYCIQNKGLDRESLQARLTAFSTCQPPSRCKQMLEEFVGQAALAELEAEMAERQKLFGWHQPEALPQPRLGYRADAKWLPFFSQDLCEGQNVTSRDAAELSLTFGAPVLAFSIFESDVLYLSYADAACKVFYDYVKENYDGFDCMDIGHFARSFPEFLTDFCGRDSRPKLLEIWEGEEVFADDRMEKLCDMLGAGLIFSAHHMPEGYEMVTCS